MKLVLYFSFLFLSIQCFSIGENKLNTRETASPGDSVEVFLSITHNDPAVYNSVKTVLETMPGVNYLAYCDKHAVFLVFVDNAKYAAIPQFLEYAQKMNPAYAELLQLKSGTFKDFIHDCDASSIADQANIKTFLSK
jgi:hypothetical protein